MYFLYLMKFQCILVICMAEEVETLSGVQSLFKKNISYYIFILCGHASG